MPRRPKKTKAEVEKWLLEDKSGGGVLAWDRSPPQKPVCDLSTKCLACGGQMVPEHAHYVCSICHQRDSCCF